jgi:hypothetical protein
MEASPGGLQRGRPLPANRIGIGRLLFVEMPFFADIPG